MLACAAACAIGGGVAQAQNDPTLVTNANDYLPGETAILMGSGFLPGETVDISIAIDDDLNNVHIGDYDWMVELADDTGDFITFWTVPLEAYGMTLRATALGLTSGYVATHTFYDSGGNHEVNFRIVGMESLVPPDGFFVSVFADTARPPVTVSTTGITSASLTVPAASTIFYGGFPTTYTRTTGANPGVYTLTETSHPAAFNVGLPGFSTTVVVTYTFAPYCTVTNLPPTLSATDLSLGDVCPADGSFTTTVSVADFLPAVHDPNGDVAHVTFADGSTTQVVTFDPFTSTRTLTLVATDDPSPRNMPSCPAIAPLSDTFDVTVSATIFAQPTNEAPAVYATNYSLGNFCADAPVTIPVSLANFNASAADPNGDPFDLSINATQVTLTLPPGVSSGVVSVPVVISATDDPSARDCGICAPLASMTGSTIVQVTATLHRNNAPILTANALQLGDIVGKLSGNSFIKTVPVSPASFGAVAVDPDGDPVTITTNVSNVTLVGPNVASATVTLTATDNPAARTGGLCSSKSTSIPVQVSARLVYRFDGVHFPLSNTTATKVRRGSLVPVFFRLYDCDNREVRIVPQNPALPASRHTIGVSFNQANAPDGAVDLDEFTLPCDEGDDFDYVLVTWAFVLQTNNSYQLNTTYRIRIYTNDGTVHSTMISIKR